MFGAFSAESTQKVRHPLVDLRKDRFVGVQTGMPGPSKMFVFCSFGHPLERREPILIDGSLDATHILAFAAIWNQLIRTRLVSPENISRAPLQSPVQLI